MFMNRQVAITLALSVGAFSTEALAGQWDGVFLGINAGVAGATASYQTGPDDYSWYKTTHETAGMWRHGALDESRHDLIGGLSLAYNKQFDSIVFGAELGLNAIDAELDHDGTYNFEHSIYDYTYHQKTNVKGLYTLRGRTGYALGDSLLSITGGLASTSLTTGLDYVDNYSVAYSAAHTETNLKAGWTVGLTYEHMLPYDLVLKAEYAYVDLGETSFSTPVTASDGTYISPMNFSSQVDLNVFTIGLEKKF